MVIQFHIGMPGSCCSHSPNRDYCGDGFSGDQDYFLHQISVQSKYIPFNRNMEYECSDAKRQFKPPVWRCNEVRYWLQVSWIFHRLNSWTRGFDTKDGCGVLISENFKHNFENLVRFLVTPFGTTVSRLFGKPCTLCSWNDLYWNYIPATRASLFIFTHFSEICCAFAGCFFCSLIRSMWYSGNIVEKQILGPTSGVWWHYWQFWEPLYFGGF